MPTLVRGPTREMVSPVLDSRRWARFEPRDGDIVIATFAKCGTTWMQRIVDLLVHGSPGIRPVSEISPWLDSTIFNPIEADLALLAAQTHRRYVKSHAPFDALPVWDSVKYIHVGRDGRDARLSWQNHLAGFRPEFMQRIIANAIEMARAAGRPAPPPAPSDPRDFLLQWMEAMEAAAPDGPGADPHYFDFEATWWRERARENLLFVHYDDMIADLAGEMRRISDFLEIDTPQSLMPALVEAARFTTMKAQGDELGPTLKLAFDRGADRFINQGRGGRWREVLRPDDVARYEALAARKASPALAAWLERGRRGAGEPRDAPD
ncbi:MAG: sulfotransferase domain-containing protein [Caulobacteraceae bacterium]|nr:sulfotransferase domain-containing protein [Caulobacteraceae bacterium]